VSKEPGTMANDHHQAEEDGVFQIEGPDERAAEGLKGIVSKQLT
jgi:hypothetical protein